MPELTIGRLRGGYCVSWRESDGRRRRFGLKARERKEAEAEAIDVFRRENMPTGGLTVENIWQDYIAYLGEKPTAKTMGYTGKAILPFFGSLRPDQITINHSRDYQAQRSNDGRKVGSVWTELGHLRSALKWAEKTGLIPRAPHIDKPAKPDSDVRPLSPNDLAKLLDGCQSHHVRLAVLLLFSTAQRVGAVLDLTWDRVDLDRGIIDFRLPDGVTRKGRSVVPMNAQLKAAMSAAFKCKIDGCDWVIEHNGNPIKSIRTGYNAALRRARLEGVHIHQIRHTAAVMMLESGVSMEEVSQFLGHSNTQITRKTYARFQPEHMQNAADVLVIARFQEPKSAS